MADPFEIKRLKDRIGDLQAEVERRAGVSPSGAAAMLAKTATKATYPTVAGAYYWMQACSLSGTEVEGGAGTITPKAAHFYAWNWGPAVPPAGTVVLVEVVSMGRWTFNYRG